MRENTSEEKQAGQFNMSSGEDGRRLTPKQQRFAEEYVIDCNGTQAAIRAGYSRKTADKIAGQLLGKTWIVEEINRLQAQKTKRTGIDADWVTNRLVAEATYDGEDSSHAARVSALTTLSKCMGMQQDKLKIEIEEPKSLEEIAEKLGFIFNEIDRARQIREGQIIDASHTQQGKDSRLLEPGESPAESPDNRDSEEVEAAPLDTIPRPADSGLL